MNERRFEPTGVERLFQQEDFGNNGHGGVFTSVNFYVGTKTVERGGKLVINNMGVFVIAGGKRDSFGQDGPSANKGKGACVYIKWLKKHGSKGEGEELYRNVHINLRTVSHILRPHPRISICKRPLGKSVGRSVSTGIEKIGGQRRDASIIRSVKRTNQHAANSEASF
ncbi:hypothetical protein JTE90_020392 [Oedothorax gibbosus]|uniref:Uncharacterized protein n=1 Tax=Oedothorax gibbosus TaxID=931172 RepID=A0AAV6UFN0_9ARAC|nr:hypothetical protein JTE90_020392 [Oedothorax gibbosus]